MALHFTALLIIGACIYKCSDGIHHFDVVCVGLLAIITLQKGNKQVNEKVRFHNWSADQKSLKLGIP